MPQGDKAGDEKFFLRFDYDKRLAGLVFREYICG